jgi:hypothetical protein
MGPGTGLDDVEKRKASALAGNRTAKSFVIDFSRMNAYTYVPNMILF